MTTLGTYCILDFLHIFKTIYTQYKFYMFLPLTKRSLSGVKLHLQHTLLHGFEVADELQERLDPHIQLGDPILRCSIDRGLVLFLEQ